MISGPGQVDVTCSARIGSRTLLSLAVQILWYDAIHAETPDQLSDECGRREQMLSMQCSILSLPLYNINQFWDICKVLRVFNTGTLVGMGPEGTLMPLYTSSEGLISVGM